MKMCCLFCCCISLKGAAYFSSSCQILLGLLIVIKYSTLLPQVKWEDFQSFSSGPIPILFLYGALILVFGCCIFRGIERESLPLLKICVGSLTILQCLVLIFHLVIISLAFDALGEEERIAQVSVLASNLLLTFVILTTLYLYLIQLSRKAWTKMSRRRGESCSGSGPIPLQNEATLRRTSGTSSSTSCCSTPASLILSHTHDKRPGGQRYVDGQWENLHV